MSLLQKRAIRIIHRTKYNAHTSPLFNKSNILTLENLYKVQCCKIVHKKQHNTLPPNIANLLFTVNETHKYATRHSTDIRPNRTINNLSKQFLSIKVASNWNSLPDPLKLSSNLSLPSFTKKLKEFL